MAERTKSNINMDEIKTERGEQYKVKMEEQLFALQAAYQQQQADGRITLDDMYQEKVGRWVCSTFHP